MYVIIGATGFLGSYMVKNILERTSDTLLAAARHPGKDWGSRVVWASCDVTSPQEVDEFVSKHELSKAKIIYLAAYHHPDQVEQNPHLAWHTNVTSLSYFLNALPDDVAAFYYPSTDSVYGESGDGCPFKECAELHPVNRYGRQKCVAEQLVTGYGRHVVRFPFLIAPSLVEGKPHFYDKIVTSLQEGRRVKMFSDSRRSAITFDTAAALTVALLEQTGSVPQVMNVCGDRPYSKYEIGLLIADRIGVSRELIQPVSAMEDNKIFTVPRAKSTLMDNSLLKQTLGIKRIDLEL